MSLFLAFRGVAKSLHLQFPSADVARQYVIRAVQSLGDVAAFRNEEYVIIIDGTNIHSVELLRLAEDLEGHII